MEVQGRRKRGRSERRWLDRVKHDIKETGRLMKCTIVLHGGVCHRLDCTLLKVLKIMLQIYMWIWRVWQKRGLQRRT